MTKAELITENEILKEVITRLRGEVKGLDGLVHRLEKQIYLAECYQQHSLEVEIEAITKGVN